MKAPPPAPAKKEGMTFREWENRKGKDGEFAWVRTPVILEYR